MVLDGMNVVITKPYKRETLLKAIDTVLKSAKRAE